MRARPRRFHFGVPQASTSRTAARKRSAGGEPKEATKPRDMEDDYCGRNPPSGQRIFPEHLLPAIVDERVDVFWWLDIHNAEGKVIDRSGRWYPAVVQSCDVHTGTLAVRYYEVVHNKWVKEDTHEEFGLSFERYATYYEGSVVGGPLSGDIDVIDVKEEHVYLVPDDESDKVRRPSITLARA